jgi:tetratricopeptide (TPR) repeat protein
VLEGWAANLARGDHYPNVLLAAGVLRLARHFDRALEILRERKQTAPKAWQAACANERAALAWAAGRAAEARSLWEAQPDSVPAWFNRGMAALFSDSPNEARPWFAKALSELPPDGGWHHLGKLYQALAEMRS